MSLKVRAAIHPLLTDTYNDFETEPKTIREIFNELGTNTEISNAIILVDDEKITDEKLDEIPQDNSRVFIRILPEGTGNASKDTSKGMMWGGGGSIALGIAALFIPVVGSFLGTALIGAGVGALLGGVILYNTKIPSVAKNREKTEPDPMLKGGRNTMRQYGAIPVLLGKHLIVPDYAATYYTEVDNDGNQWLVQLYCAGYSSMDIDSSSFKVGDTPLVNLSKTKSIENILSQNDSHVQLEVLDGEERSSSLFPNIIKEKQYFSELKRISDSGDEYEVMYTTPFNTRKITVDIFFPGGLGRYDDSGDLGNASVRVLVEYRATGSEDWETLQDWTVTAKKLKTIRKVASTNNLEIDDFNKGQWDVRVKRMTDDSNDSKTVDAVFLGSIRSLKMFSKTDSDKNRPVSRERRKRSCLLALKTRASDVAEGVIDQLNFVAQSVVPDWDGEGSGSEHWTLRATSNPASLVLYVLRGQINSTPVSDEHIDFPAFEAWHEFCEEHGMEFNACMTDTKTISELYEAIATVGRAQIVKKDGLFSISIDRAKSSPVQMFTPRNTIGFTETLLMPDVPDQVDYEFVNAEAGYQNDTLSAFNTPSGLWEDDENPPSARQEGSAWGITNSDQLFKFARYQNAVTKHRCVLYTIRCDIEFLMCSKGEWIEYAGDVALAGIAYGRISELVKDENENIIGIKSDTTLPFDDLSANYALRIRKSGGELISVGVSTNSIEAEYCVFTNSVQGIEEGDLFVFGISSKTTLDLLVTDIKPSEELTAEITCVDYAPEIFKVDNPNYRIPEFESKLTSGGTIDSGNISTNLPEKYLGRKEVFEALFGVVQTPEKDRTPPTVPDLISATSNEIGNITLVWGKSTDASGIAYYSVCHRMSETEPWSAIAYVEDSDAENITFYYEATRKNTTHYFAITATDRAGNQSAKSNEISTTATVTLSPATPQNLSVKAYESYLEIEWNSVLNMDAVFNAASYVLEISKDGGENWNSISCVVNRYNYRFNRDLDGYPEIENLINWKFRVKAKSIYGNESDWNEIFTIDFGSYLTWKIPEISFSGVAYKNNIPLIWSLENPRFFGKAMYDIYLGETLLKTTTNTNWTYFFNEFLEKPEIESLAFRIVARTEADERTQAIESIDTSGYKTWIVSRPEISAVAEEKGLRLKWRKTNDFYGTPKYTVFINDSPVFTTFTETEFFYEFADGLYLSANEVEALSATVKIETEASEATSDEAEIDVSEYKGYTPDVPALSGTGSGRLVSLRWSEPDCYGYTGALVQVAKAYKIIGGEYTPITDESELEWFAPAMGLNPYESLDNYKRGDAGGKLEIKNQGATFTVPLFGQDKRKSVNTLYAYRVASKTVKTASGWTEPFYVEATATSAQDIVDNAITESKIVDGSVTANKIFVEELAAISANLGYINDGALRGDMYNYWAVNDTRLPDDSILWKGSFRVGGTEQYIKVSPRLERGTPTGEYDIEFVVGKYSISATGSTSIQGEDFIVYDTEGNVMFKTGPNGNLIAVETGTYHGTNPVSFDFWTSPIINDIDYSKIPIGMYSRDDKIFVCIANDARTDRPSVTINMVDSDNEQLVPVNSITPDDGSSFYTNPFTRPDGTGIVFPLEREVENQADGTSFRQISLVFYDAAANSFSEETVCNTEPLEDVFKYADMKATSNGILLTEGRENQYFGLDGTSARFSLNVDNDKESKTLVYDSESEVYIIFQYWITTFVVKIDKRTKTVKHNNFLFINAEESDDALKPDHAVFTIDDDFSGSFIPYSPAIKDGKMYFFAHGSWGLDEGSSRKVSTYSISRITSGIVRIDLDNVLWKDMDDSSFGQLIKPDFYEWNELALDGMMKQAIPVDLDPNSLESFVFPYIKASEKNTTGLEPLSERLFHVDYDSAADDEMSCFWHGNAITSENVTALNMILSGLLFYGSFFIQKSLKVGNSFRVVLVTSIDLVIEGLVYYFNNNIRLTTFHTEYAESLERQRAFNSGVGFTKVLYDEASQHYRYYLDPETGTPAFLEFDKHGNLDLPSLTRGPKGERGEKGEKGDKGDQGERGEKGDDYTEALDQEAQTRHNADETLQANIEAEQGRAESAEGDLASAVAAEAELREAGDTALENALAEYSGTETTAREEADNALQGAIESEVQARGEAIQAEAETRQSADETLQSNIDAEALSRQNSVQSETDRATAAECAINAKIPNQASADNQLADKNFVNSSIQTNTAYYRGDYDTWADVPESADGYPIDSNGNREPTNNDYMTVIDASGFGDGSHTGTWRFKYTGTWSEQGMDGWLPEYEVNGTPLTAAQLAALNSNITAQKVAEIDMKANAEDVDESISTLERTKISLSLREVPSSFYNKNIDYEILMRETSHTLPACRYNLSQVLDPKADKSTVVEGLPLSLANITHNCRGTVTNTTQEYFVSNNTGVDSSTAKTTLKAKIALSNIQFNYVVRAEIADKLTITVNGTDIVSGYSGGPNGLEEYKGNYSLSTNQTIVLKFVKDGSVHSGADCAMVKIRVSGTEITCDNINDYFTVEHDTSTDYHFIGPVKASPYMTTAVTLPENSVAIDPATNRPYDGSTVNVVFSADFTAYCPKQGNKVFGKNHASGTCMRLSFLATNPSTSASDTYAFPCKNGGEYMGEGCVREGEMVKFVFFEDGANSCWHADGTDIIYKGECSDGHYVKYRGGKIEQMGKSSRYTSNDTNTLLFPICFTTVPFVIRQPVNPDRRGLNSSFYDARWYDIGTPTVNGFVCQHWDNTYDCYVAVGD